MKRLAIVSAIALVIASMQGCGPDQKAADAAKKSATEAAEKANLESAGLYSRPIASL